MNTSHEIHVAIYMPRGPGSRLVYTLFLPVVTEFGHTLTTGLWVRTATGNQPLKAFVEQWAKEEGVRPEIVSMELATLGELIEAENLRTELILAEFGQSS